jgi:hypothetical protein
MLVLLEREQGEAIGLIEVALSAGERKEQHRPTDQNQADEDLEDHDLHRPLLGESAATVAAIVVSELAGMSTAHASGDMRPDRAKATVSAL